MKIAPTLLLPILISCNLFEKSENDAIARVEDQYLLLSEIEDIIPKDANHEDSLLVINNYINNWIRETLILQKAELNLKEHQRDFQKQLEDYRKTLITYTYEKELIKQHLDTNITREEIKEVYINNQSNFELKNDIVKVRYLKVNKNAPQLKKIRKIYKSLKEKDVIELKEYAHQYSEKFHLNEDQWIYFDELKKEVPLKVAQAKGYLKNVKNIEIEDSLSYYFVFIKDYKLEKDISPMAFEEHNIKNLILNKRKMKLIDKVRNDLYQKAIANKEIEIYDSRQN